MLSDRSRPPFCCFRCKCLQALPSRSTTGRLQESTHQGTQRDPNCLAIETTNAACSGRFSRVLRHPAGGKLHLCTMLSTQLVCSTNLPQKGLLFVTDIGSKSCSTTPS